MTMWLRKLRLNEIKLLSPSFAVAEGQKQHLNGGLPHPIYENSIPIIGSILLIVFLCVFLFWGVILVLPRIIVALYLQKLIKMK